MCFGGGVIILRDLDMTGNGTDNSLIVSAAKRKTVGMGI